MMPRLGTRNDIRLEVMTQPKADYRTDASFSLDLPVAPAVMVDDEIVVEGGNVPWEVLNGGALQGTNRADDPFYRFA